MPGFLALRPRLYWQDLSDNPFTPGPIPAEYTSAVRVESLDLGSTHRTGPFPTFAGPNSFTSLSRLVLADNQLTGPIGDTLFAPYFSVLDLRRNQLTGPIPEYLAATELRSLLLSGNKLSGAVPAKLKEELGDTLITPSYVDFFGVTQVGLDLRFNALHRAQHAACLV